MNIKQQHHPVLLNEAISNLAIQKEGYYVDATFGRGGHSEAILSHLGMEGKLLVIDQDPEAILVAEKKYENDTRVYIRQGSFTRLQEWLLELGWLGKVNGILLDLGVSSPQLDNPLRGFSFQKTGPLDMRMNPESHITAAIWLARAKEGEIAKVLRDYGEEKFAKRIANAIVLSRKQEALVTTTQLATLVTKAVPFVEPGKHPATRTFQALRIVVNRELHVLKQILEQSIEILSIGGRLVVISFHSQEDQIVKEFIQHWSKGTVPSGLAVPEAQMQRRLRVISRMIKPAELEIKSNPRARSARCRVVEKLK